MCVGRAPRAIRSSDDGSSIETERRETEDENNLRYSLTHLLCDVCGARPSQRAAWEPERFAGLGYTCEHPFVSEVAKLQPLALSRGTRTHTVSSTVSVYGVINTGS